MIRNKSNIFSVDRGINRKKTENCCNNALRALMQLSALFWLIPQSTEKILHSFLIKSLIIALYVQKYVESIHIKQENDTRTEG